jgi:tetratricopeptide (TPR) repeat protein
LNIRGAAYVKKGEYDRALTDLDQAKRLQPKEAAPYKNSGLAYESRGELDKAIAEFRTALSLDPHPVIRQEASEGITRVERRLAAKSGSQPAIAQPKVVPSTPNEKRVALVIGNAAYAQRFRRPRATPLARDCALHRAGLPPEKGQKQTLSLLSEEHIAHKRRVAPWHLLALRRRNHVLAFGVSYSRSPVETRHVCSRTCRRRPTSTVCSCRPE